MVYSGELAMAFTTKDALTDHVFQDLISRINRASDSSEQKIEILHRSRGFFSAQQASWLLHAYKLPSAKIRVAQILGPRLCRMSCDEARDVLGAISIHNDRLRVLDCIKRVLSDSQTNLGMEYILSCFVYDGDKKRALSVLGTVKSYVADKIPAGGHQGYAALGGLYTQCRPLVPHLYGDMDKQRKRMPGYGDIEVPITAKPGVIPSMYTGHPSYAYPPARTFTEERGYPSNRGFPPADAYPPTYPAGAPPLGMHQGGPAPTGFPNLHYA